MTRSSTSAQTYGAGDGTPEQGQPRLHLLNKVPAHSRFQACLSALGPEDTLVLIEDAILAAVTPDLRLPAGTRVCRADLQARGLSGRPLADGITTASYEEIAELTVRHRLIVSW